MIEHMFCFVNGPGSRNRLSAGPGRASGQSPGRVPNHRRTSPEPTADHPLNPAENRPENHETIRTVPASQMQARRVACLGVRDRSWRRTTRAGCSRRPGRCSDASTGPTRPRRQRAAGPRTLFRPRLSGPSPCSVPALRARVIRKRGLDSGDPGGGATAQCSPRFRRGAFAASIPRVWSVRHGGRVS
jgi:hypothetical protein